MYGWAGSAESVRFVSRGMTEWLVAKPAPPPFPRKTREASNIKRQRSWSTKSKWKSLSLSSQKNRRAGSRFQKKPLSRTREPFQK
mmetsp:Transcript_33102/g.60714  ORF Transcript_33102/g.60714 Transcript_33102/m.60714 type:complete len:85 (-) Transcript_33102:139-393(-)